MIDPELLAILVCPATHQPLAEAPAELVRRTNERIGRGELANVGGAKVDAALDGGLVREDRKILYPIRDGIPVLLIEEGLPIG
jgi:uncharacterized protein YbaR (Trm112 family)